jgi:hypothetical protein
LTVTLAMDYCVLNYWYRIIFLIINFRNLSIFIIKRGFFYA